MTDKAKVHFAVYGAGLGHAARMSLVARRLPQCIEPYFTSWEEGREYVARKGFRVFDVAAVDVKWNEKGRMAFKGTARSLPRLYSGLALQIRQERAIMRAMRPALVVSDSRMSAVIAARSLRIPCVLVTNQLRVNLPSVDGQMMRLLERANGEFLASFWNLSDAVVVPDLPPPYTISEDVLDTLRVTRRRLRYVGFMREADGAPDAAREGGRKRVALLISGPPASRASILPLVAEAAKTLSRRYDVVLSKGNAGAPQGEERDGGLTVYEWNPDPQGEMRRADLVVARAGHSTISQIIEAARPALLMPIPFHGEQWANAEKCAKLGFAKVLDQTTGSPSELVRLAEEALSDPGMKEKVARMRDVARAHHGIESLVRLIVKDVRK
ncbi:MAG: hypothetical protein JRN39_03445 [Nitrososphaerota archaeon]|nr:hypothetical protein [Nitrososphaerota archaeon]MDG6939438.1 hypothetical protein [Nitrososphaerota archaeon]